MSSTINYDPAFDINLQRKKAILKAQDDKTDTSMERDFLESLDIESPDLNTKDFQVEGTENINQEFIQQPIKTVIPKQVKPVNQKSNQTKQDEDLPKIYPREIPRELYDAVRTIYTFPNLSNMNDIMIAFMLFQLPDDYKFSTYKPPDYIKESVLQMRKMISGDDGTEVLTSLSSTMGKLQNKLNKMDDSLLKNQMLVSYLITLGSGMHSPGQGRLTGTDLKLTHEDVYKTMINAFESFPEFKQVIKDNEGRPKKGASLNKY